MTKIGFIGAGRWSTPYALSAKHVGADIVGIYTPDTSATTLAERVGSKAIDDPRKVIELSDCVLIGSPTDTHADYLVMAAAAGRAALCASPVFAHEADRSKYDGSLAKSYASFPMRARPEYVKLKSSISNGDLGTLGMVRLGICRPRPEGWRADEERSGGALLETGIHLLDTLEWLAGPIERIYGASSKPGDSQYTLLVARMVDGTLAHLEISWAESDGVSYDYYEVAGKSGLLDFDSRREPLLVVDYLDDKPSDVLSPGATAAEGELRALIGKLNGSNNDFTGLDHGIAMCEKAVMIRKAIEAGEVLIFQG